MEIIFLGTGSGKTSLARNHSSFIIKQNKRLFLVDAGDGICKSLLQQEINYNSINSILFTHYHADHFTGIASLITQMKLRKRNEPLKIFTHKNLITPLESLLQASQMFTETLGFQLTISGFDFDQQIFVNDDFKFITRKNSHIVQKETLRNYPVELFTSYSVLFEIEKKKIVYTSDIGSETDLYLFKDEHADYFITESAHVSTSAIYSAYKNLEPEHLLITHINEEDADEIIAWQKSLPENDRAGIQVCHDGLNILI